MRDVGLLSRMSGSSAAGLLVAQLLLTALAFIRAVGIHWQCSEVKAMDTNQRKL